MEKKTKIMIGVGVVAAISAYFLFFRKGSNGDAAKMGGGTGLSIGLGPAKGKGAGNWLGVPKSSDRQLLTDNLSVGTVANYQGSPCTIKEFWTDSKGRYGAIRCEEIERGNYNAKKGETLSW